MRLVSSYFLAVLARQRLRPWGLIPPILVLLIAMPLLRPLRHPAPADIHPDEAAILATTEALALQGHAAIERSPLGERASTVLVGRHLYGTQPLVLSALLAPTQKASDALGWTSANSPVPVHYLLTLLGAALPVALSAALIYRLARVYELSRPLRCATALTAVLGSGLISYAVVLNPHAPAAFAMLAALTCIAHAVAAPTTRRLLSLIALAGLCASLAATLDSAAMLIALLLPLALLALPFSWPVRAVCVAAFLIACLPAATLYYQVHLPVTGGWTSTAMVAAEQATPPLPTAADAPEPETIASLLKSAGQFIMQLGSVLFGSHGVLSHFPVVLLGLLGLLLVLRRHWPMAMKALAALLLLACIIFIACDVAGPRSWRQPGFAARSLLVLVVCLLPFAGVWLRARRSIAAWSLAAPLLLLSCVVGILGATGPLIHNAHSGHTAIAAARHLLQPAEIAPSLRPGPTVRLPESTP